MAKSKQALRARSGKPVRAAQRPGTGWLRATGLVTAFVLGFAAAFLITSQVNGPDDTEQRIAELKAQEAARDVAQLEALTELATGTRDRLAPVLVAMAETAPTADVVAGWRTVVDAEVERWVETPSAGNGINVARTAMRGSVDQLATAVDVFTQAVAAPEPLRAELLGLAEEQRILALRTWSVAALQLDVINVDAGKGHVHVYLPASPGSGALTPDGER